MFHCPVVSKENYVTGRIDQKISEKDNLSGSYFFDSGPLTQPDPLLNARHSVFSRRQMGSAEETHIFSPQLANTIRLGISRVRGDINLPVSGDSVATNTALAVAQARRLHRKLGGPASQPRSAWEDLIVFCIAGRPAKSTTTLS